MRKTFLHPTIKNIKKGSFDWVFEQVKKGMVIKYLNKILPRKIIVGPTMAVLLVSYRCNSRCLMCDLPLRAQKTKKKEFSTKEWKRVIDQLAEIRTAGIGFTGGEPLIRNDIGDLISYAKKKKMSATLSTNGILLNKSNIKKILDSEPDNINISLDVIDAKSYDSIRGLPNGFARLINNTHNLVKQRNEKKNDSTITIVTCVSHFNINEIEKIADSAIDLGVDKIGFIPMHHIPKTKVYKSKNFPLTCKNNFPKIGSIFLKAIEKIKVKKKIEIDNSNQYLKMFPLAFKGKKFPIPCLAGNTAITIDCYGNLFLCWPFLEIGRPSFKLTGKNKLKDIWYGKEYEKARKEISNCRDCFWNCQSELSIIYQ